MNTVELLNIISTGETSKVQFKRELGNKEKIAAEMIAFANAKGGVLLLGVADKTGEIVGLNYEDLQIAGNSLATIATDSIKPLIYITTEVVQIDTTDAIKNILIVNIDEGHSKPYKDSNGAIWIKQGPDKRRITDNAEILRLFQKSGAIFVDEMVVADTSEDNIDKEQVIEYIKKSQRQEEDIEKILNTRLYNNLNILKNNKLTIAGLLFFSKDPQLYRPAFCIKAVSFFGNSIGGSEYRDNIEIKGTIPKMFEVGMRFFKTSLLHRQQGQNFNSLGILEISEIALEELLQNALVHRDYTKNAPIRLMIFDDRIEIISPGCLPNSLTVENIKLGNAAVRNNLLISYCSKLMNYRGFGSGIIRALENQPNIEFINDASGEQFIVKILREPTL
jgi:predicted HTH transcriptional regulator